MPPVASRLARGFCRALCFAVLPIAGCSDGAPTDSSDESAFTGTPRPEIGQFFMVEHFGVNETGFPDVHDAIKKKNLGAIILWNPTQASGEVARQMVAAYAKTAKSAQHSELFVAADQEEHGTQRFKSRHGFTDLAPGASLGAAVAAHGDRVCELHARITAREMASVGMNMALGTVSDIYTHDSGTPGMFRTRAISSDPNIVASCIRAMTKGYGEEGHVVFVTKHFPGLGNASGNTDVDPSVHTRSGTKSAMERELLPYRQATSAVNADDGTWPLFGVMVSHASYKILDGSGSPGTLSPVILQGLLRGSDSEELHLGGVDQSGQAVTFKGIHLQGLTVSDAFWTWGAMQGLSSLEKRRLMAESFFAGMDILMIAKADFAGAWDYFQTLVADQLPAAEQQALVKATHADSWSAFHDKFVARVTESAARIAAAKKTVGPAATFMGQGKANDASRDLVDEYETLLQ